MTREKTKKCEYASNYYGVPADIGRRIRFKGDRLGTIVKDRGNHLGVEFDDEPNFVYSLHPTWEVEYLEMTTHDPRG